MGNILNDILLIGGIMFALGIIWLALHLLVYRACKDAIEDYFSNSDIEDIEDIEEE